MQLRLRQALADQRPELLLEPQHGIPVGGMTEVADAEKVRALLEGWLCGGCWNQHQRAMVEQGRGHAELLLQQRLFEIGDQQGQVAAVDGGDFALGSTIPYVFQNAPCTVLVIREPVPARYESALTIRKD